MLLCRGMQVSAGPRVAPKEEWWNKNCPDNMREINSVQQFVDELVSRQRLRLLLHWYLVKHALSLTDT